MNYRKLLILLTAVVLTACQGPAGKNGADGLVGAAGDQGDQGITGDNGADGQDLAAPEAAIASVAPNALLVGRTTTLRVVGYFTQWDETTTVSLTDADDNAIEGVEVATVVVSPVGLVVSATVAADAALGAVVLHVATGDNVVQYAPAGASVSVTATAVANQTELRAGDRFDVLLETAEYMRNPTVNAENCLGMNGVLSRYSQYKFRLAGWMHAAASLGDCAVSLVQDADTDDAWSSAAVVSITAPDVVTFNEGIVAGELTPERNFRIVSINAGAGEVVSVRHTLDEANNLDGTGTPMAVFVEGNLEPIATHNGGDYWLEIGNVEGRELLLVTQDSNLDEGDDNTAFNLTTITPNTTMTALQDGATQDQRLPQNGDGANEAGRSSWYTITNEASVWALLGVAATDDSVLQTRFAIYSGDTVLASGSDSWEGVLEAGTYSLRVWDLETDPNDGVLSFALQLSRTVLLNLDENGAANGTLTTGNPAMVLTSVEAGHIALISASRDGQGDAPTITTVWQGAADPVASAAGNLEVPSAAGGNLVIILSLDGDLGEGVSFTVTVGDAEATAFVASGTDGSAPETGGAWFVGSGVGNGTFTVTPGNAEHLQTALSLYAGNGAPLVTAAGNEITQEGLAGAYFVKVEDTEFVAEQDQTFSLAAVIVDPAVAACADESTWLDVEANENMTWSVAGDFTDTRDVGYSTYQMVPYLINVNQPSLLDTYIDASFDSRLIVLHGCETESWYRGDTWVAHNDDGRDFDGNWLSGGAGLNGVAVAPGQYIIGVTTYSRFSNGGDFTLHYRLRSPE